MSPRSEALAEKLEIAERECPELVGQVVDEIRDAELRAGKRRAEFAEFCTLVAESGVRMTFDAERSIAKRCVICGTTDAPRKLVTVGTYTRRMGGGLMPGDRIERPLCAACEEATQ